jgi:shikimate kinase
MGSGKSTVGREVARRLGWEFADLDEIVVAAAGKDIPTIFETEGEKGFRAREVEALSKLLHGSPSRKNMVIALGGGTLTNADVPRLITEQATVVYLKIDGKQAWKRVRGSDRPLAQDQSAFLALLDSRAQTYERVADVTIDAGRLGVVAVAEKVIEAVNAPQRDGR